VVQTSIPNLHLIPCGTHPRHSHNLFATAGKFLGEIAGHYDFFVFDTAPVLVADDVLSLAPHADGVIMVIRAGFTSGRLAHAALDLLHLRRVRWKFGWKKWCSRPESNRDLPFRKRPL
jgi:succinoglycan biosynthesis transport protein ExoP